MANSIATWFANNWGQHVSPYFIIFFVSLLPILELRGGLIVASLLHVPMWSAIPFCVIGNILPIPFILLLINRIFGMLKKTKHFKKPIEKIEARAMKKSSGIQNGEFWGLVAFVGIPLPGTGAWTGSLIASLLGVDRKKAFLAVLLGIAIACVIMCFVSYGLIGKAIR